MRSRKSNYGVLYNKLFGNSAASDRYHVADLLFVAQRKMPSSSNLNYHFLQRPINWSGVGISPQVPMQRLITRRRREIANRTRPIKLRTETKTHWRNFIQNCFAWEYLIIEPGSKCAYEVKTWLALFTDNNSSNLFRYRVSLNYYWFGATK